MSRPSPFIYCYFFIFLRFFYNYFFIDCRPCVNFVTGGANFLLFLPLKVLDDVTNIFLVLFRPEYFLIFYMISILLIYWFIKVLENITYTSCISLAWIFKTLLMSRIRAKIVIDFVIWPTFLFLYYKKLRFDFFKKFYYKKLRFDLFYCLL